MNPVRESDPGEVWVSGSNLATGYVGGQAPEKFCDNPHASSPGKLFSNIFWLKSLFDVLLSTEHPLMSETLLVTYTKAIFDYMNKREDEKNE